MCLFADAPVELGRRIRTRNNFMSYGQLSLTGDTVHSLFVSKLHYFYLLNSGTIAFSRKFETTLTAYAIARPSIRLSVCLSDGWIIEKRLKLGL